MYFNMGQLYERLQRTSLFPFFLQFHQESVTLLKGIKTRIGVLGMQFKIPFFRDFAMATGVIDVSRSSLVHAIKKGISPMIIIGGAQEALDAHPGKSDIVLLRRKGFVKLALETGSNLVPIYCFGENSLFSQYPNERGSKVRNYQEYFKDMLGFSMPLFHGNALLGGN
jgi:1-acyl-sn-glycerol-3-phosphate acyltransferase